jgi:predicted AAA+ superfamily ATPase
MIDTGLAANLLGVTERRLHMRDPAALTEFGHLVETFAVNELLKQGGWSESLLEFSHFRTKELHEVDLVIESHEGMVAGVEVKAKSSIEDKDFRGLRLLRDSLGKDFVAGVLINLGQLSYTYDDRLYVMPLDRLWTPVSQIASAH